MPGFTTHYILGKESYRRLPDCRLKHTIGKYKKLYQLGLQGPDIFFYYAPLQRFKGYKNVGRFMHDHKISSFFKTCLRKISQTRDEADRERGIAYFCGYLSHYIGDYIGHPYVYGTIGFAPEAPALEMHAHHAALENDIDALLLWKYEKKKPSEFDQAESVSLDSEDERFVTDFLYDCINEALYTCAGNKSYRLSRGVIKRSLTATRLGCRLLADPSKVKTRAAAAVEHLIRLAPAASSKLVKDEAENPREALNLEHKIWSNPWKPELKSGASFPELFEQSLKESLVVYGLLDSFVCALTKSEAERAAAFRALTDELGSRSLHSGLEERGA